MEESRRRKRNLLLGLIGFALTSVPTAVMARPAVVFQATEASSGSTVTVFPATTIAASTDHFFTTTPNNGGHVTVFVNANQPGNVDVYECSFIGGVRQCHRDTLTPGTVPGDGEVHQAVDDYTNAAFWQIKVTNTGTVAGTYTVTVVDRPWVS